MSVKTDRVNLIIDGKTICVPKGTTVYTAARELEIAIPIFCYQDRMPPFGACRVCLVEVEKMAKLQASCTLEATEGMVVKTQSEMALEGRKGILEFLLINHPLDCPICDRGGECPLQEQTLTWGPGESRFYEEKRHFKKPIPLGSVLMLDRERCIACARCTRFGDVLAGDHALEFVERGYKTEVGTPDGGPAESKFIGNTIMICPVGALTSQVYRFRARPWDNESAQSTCTLCPVGCSMILDSRDGEIMRTRSLENKDVNDIWLCDKGWFGYEFSSSSDRLQNPLIRIDGKLHPATWDDAISLVAKKIKEFRLGGRLAGFGGNPLTVEENYLFQKLIREGAGVNHLDHRIGMPLVSLEEEGISPGMEMSIGECEELSLIVLLGIDITEEFPVIWLRLRQAVNRGAKMIFIGHFAPEIEKYMTNIVLHRPGDEINILKQQLPCIKTLSENGGKGAIFIGRQYLSSPHRLAILSELSEFRKRMPEVALNILEGRGNSIGARFAGMRPDLGPEEKRLSDPGLNAVQVLEKAANTGWDFLYVAGANPAEKYPLQLWRSARSNLNFLVVNDLFLTETALQADVVLPALSFVEKGGSFINIEGRVQKLEPGKEIPENILSDGEIFTRIAERLGLSISVSRFSLKDLRSNSPRSCSLHSPGPEKVYNKAGTLASSFAHLLFDNGVRMRHDSHLIQLAKEGCVRIHHYDGESMGIKEGDNVRIKNNDKAITARVRLDKRVSRGTIVLPIGIQQVPVYELGPNLMNGLEIEITKITE